MHIIFSGSVIKPVSAGIGSSLTVYQNPVLQTEPGESQLHTQKKHRGRGKGVDHGPPQHADGT